MSNTVTPSVDQDGNFIGAEIQHNSEGLWRQTQNEYIETAQGIKHRFADVELEDEQSDGHFDFIEYAADLRIAYPQLDAAISWAAQGNAHGFDIEAYNQAVDSENLSEINAGAERLIALYQETSNGGSENDSQQDDDSDNAVDEWFNNLSDDFIDNTLEDLSNASYTPEQVDVFEQLATSYDSNSIEAVILNLGVAIGNGEMSSDDAIEWALENYDEGALAAAYVTLANQLN